ncbi:hypothetical protein FIC_02297 [Flavobacteriaceae bacterium 3519-10]|nr:hypothetical protein FIC_02297 [Flavobacteriaceae bacterium 3519-10]
MKRHQLILLTTVLFITLFYGEDTGINVGILGVATALLTFFHTPETRRTRTFLILFVTTILSSVAFVWYGDFVSFLATFTSCFLLIFHSRNSSLKSILVIPVFAFNFVTFPVRVFRFDQWLPKANISESLKKLVASVLIPAGFVVVFFGVYSLGSAHFSSIFDLYRLDFNLWEFFALSCVGFFLAFNFWNFRIDNSLVTVNHKLKNDFSGSHSPKPTFSFLDFGAERKSGFISFAALNLLLIIFLTTFIYEQFFESAKTSAQLSAETHDRVNAVILSIIMAVLVIMFYFKGYFNFDPKARYLKIMAKIWIFLNVLLVVTAFTKNAEYFINLGFTYKRLGVFAFLILAFAGLLLTFIKIQRQKTNAFLINHIVWYFYGTVLVCSYFNWGGFITSQNLKRANFDLQYHHKSVNYNELQLLDYAGKERNLKLRQQILNQIESEKSKTFLSGTLFYQNLRK